MNTTILPQLPDRLSAIEGEALERITQTWTGDGPELQGRHVAELVTYLASSVEAAGDQAQAVLGRQGSEDRFAYFLTYEWLDDALDYLVLLRDMVFEYHRADILLRENRLTRPAFATFEESSREQARLAGSALFDKLKLGSTPSVDLDKRIKKWKLENSPWPVIREQLRVIVEQVGAIGKQAVQLEGASVTFREIHECFAEAFRNYLNYLSELTAALDLSLHPEATETAAVSPASLLKQLRQFSTKSPMPVLAAGFIDRLDELTARLPSTERLIIGTEGGSLQQREINLREETRTWLQSELMSEVQDFYNRREQINNRLLAAIRTGENRLEFDRQEGQTLLGKDIPRALEQLVKNINRSSGRIRELEQKTLRILAEELSASNAFRPDFLEFDLQQTLNQYRKYQQTGVAQLKNWLVGRGRQLVSRGRDSLRSEDLSPSEKIVRLVNDRRPQSANAHYTGMFVNAGFLGESFRVGREAELARVGKVVDNWEKGFRGSVMVTGSRHSGKSFFAELIGHTFFANDYIDLRPNVRLSVAGRTLEPTEDLGEALKFVVANCRLDKKMVLIDDLADWQDMESPLSADVKQLLENLDDHAGQLFFVVVTDTVLYEQLRVYFEIDRYFQVTLPMNRLSTQEISEAIFIRHGATQMQIVNQDGNELLPEEALRRIRPIAQRAHGHIGDALRLWAYAVRLNNEDSIRVEEPDARSLEAVFTKDAGILLRAILVDRTTSEYQLRKQFGPLFREVFQPLVQRYLQLGLLVRRPNGALEITPAIVGDLERELHRQSFIPTKLSSGQNERI